METGTEAGQHGAEVYPDTPVAGDKGHGTERAVKKCWANGMCALKLKIKLKADSLREGRAMNRLFAFCGRKSKTVLNCGRFA